MFIKGEGWKLKILGDWTMRYIYYENRAELLLSGKYDTYDIAAIAIKGFYESVGKEVPEWLTRFVPDIVQEELDTDEETIIRNILFDHVNRTVERNSRLAALLDSDGCYIGPKKTGVVERVRICLENDLWSWISLIKNQPRERLALQYNLLDGLEHMSLE